MIIKYIALILYKLKIKIQDVALTIESRRGKVIMLMLTSDALNFKVNTVVIHYYVYFEI